MKKIDLKKKKVTKKSLAACVMKLYCILFIIGEAFICFGPLFVISYYNFGSFYPLKFKDTTWCGVKYFYIFYFGYIILLMPILLMIKGILNMDRKDIYDAVQADDDR
jgi:hypothetical protein